MDNTQQDDEQDNEQRNGTEIDVPAKKQLKRQFGCV